MTIEKDRKQLTYAERAAVAAEIVNLLEERDEHDRKRYSQQSLGKALGGLSQETVRRSRDPDQVGPAAKEGLLKLLGTSIEELVLKHHVPIDPAVVEKARAEAIAKDPFLGMFDVQEQRPPEIKRLQRETMALLMQKPYEYEVGDAWRMSEGLLYARKHTTVATPERLAQLAHLMEQELRGAPIGTVEDERSLPAPPAADTRRRAK